MKNTANVTKLDFKDGDDGGSSAIGSIHMDIVNNGYIVTYFYEDGTQAQEVFLDLEQVFYAIKSEVIP